MLARAVMPLIHFTPTLSVVVAKPRAHFVTGALGVATIVRAIAIPAVTTAAVPIFVAFTHALSPSMSLNKQTMHQRRVEGERSSATVW
jgi:hypothetical protein